ncbi:MAG: NADPH-dependent F420 reductase [Proteobacteria bacterium]|nr:NADPH-dependent F420 reductase [Pseudomonadota bacterium]NOG59548.1 NADPH-dependent F420 reductase [Pseudomonadota bacterium]
MNESRKKIAVLGGTGNLGLALAWRWARVEHEVIIGSRTEEKAQQAAAEINRRTCNGSAHGKENAAAAKAADIIVMTVPFAAHDATIETIKPYLSGQILIDTTVPLKPPKVNVVQLPETGCVAVQTQVLVGDKARVVAAFHNVAANLLNKDTDIDCDVLVTSDDLEAKKEVMQLSDEIGCNALNAGALANAIAAEVFTSILIHMNKTYKTGHAGIKITGL